MRIATGPQTSLSFRTRPDTLPQLHTMKRILLTAFAALAAALAAHAQTLANSAPAYAAPADTAPILGTAKAGSRLADTAAPVGWQAVELAGPHTVYVTEKDTLKNFEVRPGGAYYSAPHADAPVIGLAGDKDPAAFADIEGTFNKFSLNKPIVAYVRVAAVPVIPVTPPPAPATTPAPATDSAALQPPPAAPGAMGDTLRNDIPASSPTAPGRGLDAGEPSLARTFFGTVASTRNPLRPRRPYDFQLNDAAGARIAYLDISRLMLTERIEAFVGRPVSLFGIAQPVGDSGSEIVIRVETLKLQ